MLFSRVILDDRFWPFLSLTECPFTISNVEAGLISFFLKKNQFICSACLQKQGVGNDTQLFRLTNYKSRGVREVL
jgi:hypothetical protein